MDKITEALLLEFSNEFGIGLLKEDSRFEHFATWLTVRRHYSETTFDPGNLVTGKGDDTGIDAIGIVVNNNLVTDVDTIDDLLSLNGYLDVSFVFVQAERSAHFDTGKIGKFGFGVKDFFGEGKLPRNEAVQSYSEIMSAIYAKSAKFRPGNPQCYLYYVTTGKWNNEKALTVRAEAEVNDLTATGMFSKVDFVPIGADQIQNLYRQTKNAISREFVFDQKVLVPEVGGVSEAYLGFLKATEFLKLVCEEDGGMIKSLFYENVRDWIGYNPINTEIRGTLSSDFRDRFVLMNNGVTMIARMLKTTGNKFTMGDFQVVNGCQTSHVLHDNSDLLNESVRIPFRLICTQDEAVIESVIRATNRQTEVQDVQFFAMKDFAKKIETYFKTFPVENRIYYERRPHQYDSQDIEKSRIIAHQNLVRAVGAMFLGEPHITTRSFRTLASKVGKDMFADTDKLEPYYAAAFALYKIERLFKTGKIDARYKAARYQILLAVRLLMDAQPLPQMNSNEMAKRCIEMMKPLWDDAATEKLFLEAVHKIDDVAGTGWTRDSIRTEPVTKAILAPGK
jgi:hypothetical protein